MSQDAFNQRIARIHNRPSNAQACLSEGDGIATNVFSSPVPEQPKNVMRGGYKTVLMGLVIGMIIGTIAAGLENASMPWGPGWHYNGYATLVGVGGLCAGPVMAILGSVLRRSMPGFFLFSAAYFPAVVAAALIDLPLF